MGSQAAIGWLFTRWVQKGNYHKTKLCVQLPSYSARTPEGSLYVSINPM